jgi:hypothetical protein
MWIQCEHLKKIHKFTNTCHYVCYGEPLKTVDCLLSSSVFTDLIQRNLLSWVVSKIYPDLYFCWHLSRPPGSGLHNEADGLQHHNKKKSDKKEGPPTLLSEALLSKKINKNYRNRQRLSKITKSCQKYLKQAQMGCLSNFWAGAYKS